MRHRPLIALPQRYSASTSALRYEAVVTARALAEAVARAGGEPRGLVITVRPAPQVGSGELIGELPRVS